MENEILVRPFKAEDEGVVIELWDICFPDDPP